ncbi:SDR family oxidoreductase [Parvularcula marina]|uniref:SDR family oxidoreductase n=1 Tax=Parvularcula marina TaxID=2292771 RepID=UPI0035120545
MKRVLVTGSAKRLGAVIARHLKAQGWQPVIHYNRSSDEARVLADELGTVAVGADLSDAAAVSELIGKAANSAGGPLSALINNASIFEHDRAGDVSEASLMAHFRTNTLAPVLLARAFADQADKADDPVIVNILDQKLSNLYPDHYSYTLSKSALQTATHLMAQDFAPHIRVCGVAPGYTLPSPGESEAAFEKKAASANPLGRRLDPEDIARTVAFCLSCRAITGQTILADNGEHLIPTHRDISFKGEGK